MDVIRKLFSALQTFRIQLLAGFCLLFFGVQLVGGTVPYINVLIPEITTLTFLSICFIITLFPQLYRWICSFALIVLLGGFLITDSPLRYHIALACLIVTPRIPVQYIVWPVRFVSVLLFILMKRYFWFMISLFLTFAVLAMYSLSFQSYFEGDEWIYFRTEIPTKLWMIQGFIDTFFPKNAVSIHMTPVSNMLYVIQYKLFGLRFSPYLLTGIFLHVLMSMSLGYFIYVRSLSKKLALIGIVLFAFTSVHAQAITWVIASVNTVLAMLFGLWSQLFLLRSLQKPRSKILLTVWALLLLLAVWTKETAIIFFPLSFFLYWSEENILKKRKYHMILLLVCAMFLTTQIFSRKVVPHIPNALPTQTPWVYAVFNKIENLELSTHLYRLITIGLKSLTQAFVPHSYLRSLSILVTDLQFPYFNAEKSVRGTTYLSFIQVVPPELFSYGIGVSILSVFLVTYRKVKRDRIFYYGCVWVISAIIPIFLITFQFPWWSYSAYIDSRHLYHLLPGIVLIIISYITQYVQRQPSIITAKNVSLLLLLLLFVAFHVVELRSTTRKHQIRSDFASRKVIVEKLTQDINPVPKKMIIYTTSNKSYYGFGFWMLPFQTAFSHVLPILFSQPYNPHGHIYPPSFYNLTYLEKDTAGLVTQGYHEDGEYGLGYYLEEVPLIKLLEERQFPVDMVYAFKYDGDAFTLDNNTQEFRERLQKTLDSRKEFREWQRVGSEQELFSFQIPADWDVQKTPTGYRIRDARAVVIDITIFQNPDANQFSQFVEALPENADEILQMRSTQSDLDIGRVIILPEDDSSILFTVAGNNQAFYRIEFNTQLQQQILRTFEFVDQPNERISL